MKKLVTHVGLSVLLINSLLVGCTSNSDQKQETTTTATVPETPLQSGTVADTTPAAKPIPTTTASGQDYSFTPATDSLQIVGTENQYDILLPTDVLFDFDKSDLRPEGFTLLEKVKAYFAQHGADQLHVWGHTDSKGSDQYNAVLSQKRAVTVANWLKKQIKVKGLIMAIGRGEKEPLVPNENPDGTDNPVNRQKNRRVTLSVVKYPDAGKMIQQAKDRANKN